jgi:hypothetical protein
MGATQSAVPAGLVEFGAVGGQQVEHGIHADMALPAVVNRAVVHPEDLGLGIGASCEGIVLIKNFQERKGRSANCGGTDETAARNVSSREGRRFIFSHRCSPGQDSTTSSDVRFCDVAHFVAFRLQVEQNRLVVNIVKGFEIMPACVETYGGVHVARRIDILKDGSVGTRISAKEIRPADSAVSKSFKLWAMSGSVRLLPKRGRSFTTAVQAARA